MRTRILDVEGAFDSRQILRDLLANAGFELFQATDSDAGACGEALQSVRDPRPDSRASFMKQR
jgi:hypothetical protein